MKRFGAKLPLRHVILTLLILALINLALGAGAAGPPQDILSVKNPRVQAVMQLQTSVTPGLMAMKEILGTATGLDGNGQVAIVIYVNQEHPAVNAVVGALPRAINGTPVRVEITEPFVALGKPAGTGKPKPAPTVDHRAIQEPPIQLGTSGGWSLDLANGYCCGGTLGSLIEINGEQFILSNYHVFESDIVSGGNGIVASTGDPVIQPGLIDVQCNYNAAQPVATLVQSSSLPNANVDASIAAVVSGMVDSSGAILEIGPIAAETTLAYVNQAVKKSGRTTGLSTSKVSALNGIVNVTYDNECAGDVVFTKTYVGQIIIQNRRSKFLAGGDSGSLMVENVESRPRAVGLLYAGSSTLAVANPIDEVLGFFGASMVGN